MPTRSLRALGAAAALFSLATALPATAGTISQPFTVTLPFDITSVANGTYVALVPNADFSLHLLPFSGSGLTSAVFNYSVSLTGNILPASGGGGTSIGIAAMAALEGTAFWGIGGTGGNGGPGGVPAPFSVTAPSGGADLFNAFGQSHGFPAIANGTDYLDFTFSGGNQQGGFVAVADHPQNVAEISGTAVLTGTLTYTFSGDGALLSMDVPEPASLALLGLGLGALGLARRRR